MIAQGNEQDRYMEVKRALRNIAKAEAIVQSTSQKAPRIVRFKKFEASRDPVYQVLQLSKRAIAKADLYAKLQADGFTEEEVERAVLYMINEGEMRYHIVKEARYEGAWYISYNKNSAEHDIYVNIISRHLTSIGIRNTVHNAAYGPDVVAFKDRQRIAIEYETGSNSMQDATRMLQSRKKGFNKIVVVAKQQNLDRYQNIEGVTCINTEIALSGNW
jgi:hypothetical protein